MNEETPESPAEGAAGPVADAAGAGSVRNPLQDIGRCWIGVIAAPWRFFAAMPDDGGLVPPLVFAVATGLAAGVVRLILGLAGWGFYMSAGSAMLAIILTPIFVTVGSFIGGGILYLIWQAMGSKECFETSYRCAAYVTAIAPIAVLLRLIPYAGGVLALAWGCGLLIVASEKVHRIARNKALIVFGIIFVVLAALSLLTEYHARHLLYQLGNWRVDVKTNG